MARVFLHPTIYRAPASIFALQDYTDTTAKVVGANLVELVPNEELKDDEKH